MEIASRFNNLFANVDPDLVANNPDAEVPPVNIACSSSQPLHPAREDEVQTCISNLKDN